jgi:c-di-GMP-binding flagellar brake protein YcgR
VRRRSTGAAAARGSATRRPRHGHHKTRFLSEGPDGFWIESVPDERPTIESLMEGHGPVGVAFKVGHNSVAFTSVIRGFDPVFQVNDQTRVEALYLPFPENFRMLQRRQVYRVALPMTHDVGLRVWHVPEHAILRDRPLAVREVPVRMTNLSVAGLAAIARVGRKGEPPRMVLGERLRIVMTWQEEELLMEGRVIHARPASVKDQVVFGLQFKRLEKDIEGRQALAKLTEIVGVQQREEIKRRRQTEEAVAA